MQYDVETAQEYLHALADDWRREKVEELRAIIMECDPDLREEIRYKMLAYCHEGDIVFGLNAQKGYVSLYVGDAKKIDPEGGLLKGLSVGKGCIRFAKSKRIAATGIREFIERTVAMVRRGEDVYC
jgi:uncharacterized protein YdhG (YjbR/CyaY superfamily)